MSGTHTIYKEFVTILSSQYSMSNSLLFRMTFVILLCFLLKVLTSFLYFQHFYFASIYCFYFTFIVFNEADILFYVWFIDEENELKKQFPQVLWVLKGQNTTSEHFLWCYFKRTQTQLNLLHKINKLFYSLIVGAQVWTITTIKIQFWLNSFKHFNVK